MSPTTTLQLFPSSNPYKNGPKRKGSRRYPVKPQSPEPMVEEVKASDNGTKAVVIQVFEDNGTCSLISSPPKAHVAERSRSNTPTSQLCERRGAASPAPLRAASPADSLNRSTYSTSPTLVRSDSVASTTETRSPLMRSIFPRYNPNLPLSQQRYHPNPASASPTNLPREVISKAEYSPSLYSPGSGGGVGTEGKAEVLRMTPLGNAYETTMVKYSTIEELGSLWEAANGQSSYKLPECINMQISRVPTTESPQESWVFGPSATQPFYDLQTHTASEVTIRRHHPHKANTVVPIAMLDLEPSTRHLPPADGFITLIFPKLAALMAMDQAASTASKYNLPQSDREALSSEAVARAAEQEGCQLRRDADSGTYQLIHPTLGSDSCSQPFPIVVEGIAGLTTSTSSTSAAKGTISLLSPTDSTYPLVSLDSRSQSLTISARALTNAYPSSLYIVDVAVTAVLTVALLEGRRSRSSALPSPTPTMTFSAPPTIAEMEEGRTKGKGAGSLLEKYAGDERELPRATRGVLRLLDTGFRLAVWALGLLVELLASVVLTVSACAQKV